MESMTSSPISTPSGSSMENAPYWNGKHLRPDTRKNPTGCFPWILNFYVTRWMTGIAEVAQVVFVRKHLVEVQYLRTTISDGQREEFGRLVQDAIRRIESAQFLPHSGIRFPQNPCTSCPYVGLCLGKQEMANARLVRRPGAESLDWLDELRY